MVYKVEILRISPQNKSHFLFAFPSLGVFLYASRSGEPEFSLEIPLSPWRKKPFALKRKQTAFL